MSVVCGLAGLAIGFWMRDSVRGLIASVAAWMVFLFGTDLLLLALAGAPLLQQNPDLWIAPLMANPLDAFRVTNPVLRRARGVQRAQCRPARRMVGRACPALAGDRLHDLGGRFDCDGVARSAAAA